MSDLLKKAYPDLPLSDDLNYRVGRLASAAESRNARRRRYATSFRVAAVAAVALVCIVAAPLLLPRVAVARTLERAASALRQVNSIHLTSWLRSTNGQMQRWETWQNGSQRRIEADGGAEITVFTGNKLYLYKESENRTTVRATPQFAAFQSSGPTLSDLQSDLKRWGWKDKLEMLPDQVEGGKIWRRVCISREEPAGPIRTEIWVDPATDLPARADIFLYRNGTWTQQGGTRMAYNEPLSKDRFAPPVAKGVTLEDLDQTDRNWRDVLNKGIASTVVGGRKVTVRSVEVDPRGNIFVLYTAGKSEEDAFHTDKEGTRWYSDSSGQARDWELELTDANGVRYARQTESFETGADAKTHQMTLGARPILDGEKLEMDWFVPLTAKELQHLAPGKLTLKIKTAAQNLHGEEFYAYRSSQPHLLPAQAQIVTKATPLRDAVPAWWIRFIGDGSRNAAPVTPEEAIRIKEAEARADYFVWDKTAQNLPLALSWLKAEDEVRPANDPSRYNLYFRYAECLGMMKRTEEARAEVKKAVAAWPTDWKNRSTLYTQAAGISRSLGDEAAAQSFIDQAIQESPSDRDWLTKSSKNFRRW